MLTPPAGSRAPRLLVRLPFTLSEALTALNESAALRVLIADDQQLVRAGFRMILATQPGLDVVGGASTGDEAIMLARTTRPDVILMDIRMPDTHGIEATRRILADGGPDAPPWRS